MLRQSWNFNLLVWKVWLKVQFVKVLLNKLGVIVKKTTAN
jgi:hypothetical protein